ncbi:6-phospho-beta-glucosidase [Flindersiella endophytica]
MAILGGGGFRVPLVYRALLHDTGSPRVTDVVLYDTDPGRLAVIAAVLKRLAGPAEVAFTTTTELDEAVTGADFVFSAIRVGGLEGRTSDERVALGLGVLGQETTGPGGLAYALRTIPVVRRIAERVRELAGPRAYVINFTNPAGLITETMQATLGERVIGICDTPGAMGRRVAQAAGADPDRARLDYIGLNHLGWLRRVVVDGEDRLPALLADDEALGGLEETGLFGAGWLRSLGSIPNEYLHYYYFNRDAVQKITARSETRGEFLLRQQAAFYAEAAKDLDAAYDVWQRTLAEREATYMAESREQPRHVADRTAAEAIDPGGYEGVALAVMAAIARNERATMILNVRNGGAVPGLDDDAVVEIPALLDATGPRPLATTPPSLHQLGLMAQLKAVERLTIRAAVEQDRDLAVQAFALHPLVDSVTVARELATGYGL